MNLCDSNLSSVFVLYIYIYILSLYTMDNYIADIDKVDKFLWAKYYLQAIIIQTYELEI